MVKSAVARTVDLDPIDRLEDKVKLLVGLVTFGLVSACVLLVTTAGEDLSPEEFKADPEAGYIYELGVPVKGVFDAAYRL
jgi:sugar lactone lactonase YvrE